MKKISIVTPSYNQGEFMRQCIESIRAQNDPCYEHIVMDGGSTDRTVDILREYPEVRWVSEPDNGQCAAINRGFEMAEGEIFGSLSVDDYYLPGAFDVVRREFAVEGTRAITGGAHIYGNDDAYLNTWLPIDMDHEGATRFLKRPIAHVATFYTRELWEALGGMQEGMRFAPDQELWLRMTELTTIRAVESILAAFRLQNNSNSGRVPLRGKVGALYHLAHHGVRLETFHEMYQHVSDWEFKFARKPELLASIRRSHGGSVVDGDVMEKAAAADMISKYMCLLWRALNGKRVAIYGAGLHTKWLLNLVRDVNGPTIVNILDDDKAKSGTLMQGIRVVHPTELRLENVDAIVLSSDVHEAALKEKAEEFFGDRASILPLYGDQMVGPFHKIGLPPAGDLWDDILQ